MESKSHRFFRHLLVYCFLAYSIILSPIIIGFLWFWFEDFATAWEQFKARWNQVRVTRVL